MLGGQDEGAFTKKECAVEENKQFVLNCCEEAKHYIDGLVQDCSISIASAVEML